MESQPQNPEFRNYPENFHPCECECEWSAFLSFAGFWGGGGGGG